MPPYGPVSRRDLIRSLKRMGWEGPYAGGRHEYLTKGAQRLVLPNPHGGDISVDLLARILRQAGIERAVWEAA